MQLLTIGYYLFIDFPTHSLVDLVICRICLISCPYTFMRPVIGQSARVRAVQGDPSVHDGHRAGHLRGAPRGQRAPLAGVGQVQSALPHPLVDQPSLHQQPCARGPNGRASLYVVRKRVEVCVGGRGGQ